MCHTGWRRLPFFRAQPLSSTPHSSFSIHNKYVCNVLKSPRWPGGPLNAGCSWGIWEMTSSCCKLFWWYESIEPAITSLIIRTRNFETKCLYVTKKCLPRMMHRRIGNTKITQFMQYNTLAKFYGDGIRSLQDRIYTDRSFLSFLWRHDCARTGFLWDFCVVNMCLQKHAREHIHLVTPAKIWWR